MFMRVRQVLEFLRSIYTMLLLRIDESVRTIDNITEDLEREKQELEAVIAHRSDGEKVVDAFGDPSGTGDTAWDIDFMSRFQGPLRRTYQRINDIDRRVGELIAQKRKLIDQKVEIANELRCVENADREVTPAGFAENIYEDPTGTADMGFDLETWLGSSTG